MAESLVAAGLIYTKLIDQFNNILIIVVRYSSKYILLWIKLLKVNVCVGIKISLFTINV